MKNDLNEWKPGLTDSGKDVIIKKKKNQNEETEVCTLKCEYSLTPHPWLPEQWWMGLWVLGRNLKKIPLQRNLSSSTKIVYVTSILINNNRKLKSNGENKPRFHGKSPALLMRQYERKSVLQDAWQRATVLF